MEGIAQFLFNEVVRLFSEYARAKSGVFLSFITPFVVFGLTVYIWVMGIQIAQGRVSSPVQDTIWKLFRVIVITTLFLGSGVYGENVIAPFEYLRDGLSGALTNSKSPYEALDKLWVTFREQGKANIVEAEKPSFFPIISRYIAAIFLFIAGAFILIACAFPLLLSYVNFYIALTLGPIFIACALFPPTQKYFDSWLSTVLSAAMTNVVVSAIIAALLVIFTSLVQRMNTAMTAADYITPPLGTLIAVIMLCWVAWKSGDFAAQLVGGSSISNPMASNPASAALGGATNALKKVPGAVGQVVRALRKVGNTISTK